MKKITLDYDSRTSTPKGPIKMNLELIGGIVFVLFLVGVTVWLFQMWLSAVKCGRQLLAQDQLQSMQAVLGQRPSESVPMFDGETRMYCLINVIFGGLTCLMIGYLAVAGLISCGLYLCS